MISLSDTIDADSLLHGDVPCFDHHAAGQRTILVSHLHIVSMVTAFHQLNTENVETEVEIIHPSFLACSLVPLHKDASHNKLTSVVRLNTDRAGAQSIELKIHEDRARNVLSSACFGEESVERIVSSINGLVTGHLLVPLHSSFEIQVTADDVGCASDLFLCASSACRMSTVSPCTYLRVLGSRSLAVCSRVLGSHSLAVFLSFHHLSTVHSLLELVLELVPLLLSFSLTDTVSSRGLCHLLTLCSLASLTWKRSRSFNESVRFSSCSRYDCDLPPSRPSSQLLLSALLNLPLPVAFSSDHHISLQSRQQCPDLPQFQHLTLLMWF